MSVECIQSVGVVGYGTSAEEGTASEVGLDTLNSIDLAFKIWAPDRAGVFGDWPNIGFE